MPYDGVTLSRQGVLHGYTSIYAMPVSVICAMFAIRDLMAVRLTEEQKRKDAAALIEDNKEVFDRLDD